MLLVVNPEKSKITTNIDVYCDKSSINKFDKNVAFVFNV